MPAPAYTPGPIQVSLLASTAKQIVPYNPNRSGLLLSNASASTVYISFGSNDPSASSFSWRLAANDQFAVPMYGVIQEVRAFCTLALALTGGFTYTEFTI